MSLAKTNTDGTVTGERSFPTESFCLSCRYHNRAEKFTITQTDQGGLWRVTCPVTAASSSSASSDVLVGGADGHSAQQRFIREIKGGEPSDCPSKLFSAMRGTTLSDSKIGDDKAGSETVCDGMEITGGMLSPQGKKVLQAFLPLLVTLSVNESGSEEELGKE